MRNALQLVAMAALAVSPNQTPTPSQRPVQAPFQFQGAALGMTFTDFRKLKDEGKVFVHGAFPGDPGREIASPVCSDTAGVPFLAHLARPGEIVCDVHYGDQGRNDLIVAGEHVTNIRFSFYKERLEAIWVGFNGSKFETIANAFDEKYGKHDAETLEEYQNGFGAARKSRLFTWSRGVFQLRLAEGVPSGNVTGSATFADMSNWPPDEKPIVDF